MEEALTSAASNPYIIFLGIIGGFFSVIALPLAIYIYFKQKRDKLPRFGIASNNLVSDLSSKVDRVTVLFDNVKVANLTITKLYFWNAGRETILREDIAQSDPLRVGIRGAEILDARIIETRRQACSFELNPDAEKSGYELTFEFVDYWDAVVIQIIHTAQSHEEITFRGTIKGSSGLRRISGTSMRRLVLASLCVFSTFGSLMLLLNLTDSIIVGAIGSVIAFVLSVMAVNFLLKDENWLVHRGLLDRKSD